jgi:DNA-binding MarR family transcriptional regulator
MPTATPAETSFRSLIRAFGRLERVMEPYFATFGISGSQWGVLRNLHRAQNEEGQDGLRLSDLSRRLLVRAPSVTGIVDRLERARLVARAAEEGDRRSRRVSLTDAGRRLVERVLSVHRRQIGQVMGGLDAGEQVELGRLLGRLNEHLEKLEDNGPVAAAGKARGRAAG